MRLQNLRFWPKLPWILLILITAASAIAEFPSKASFTQSDNTSDGAGPQISTQAKVWIENGLSALNSELNPMAGLEIVSDYEYYSGDGQRQVRDITRITLPSTLWQERRLEGGDVRRGLSPENGAFMESPRGEVELEPEQEAELASYLCLRRIPLLSFCDDFAISLEDQTSTNANENQVWLRIKRKGDLFARLALDASSSLPVALQWDQHDDFSDIERITTHFHDYQAVDGWMLPHTVESFIEDEPFYRYRVVSASVQR